jgi:REP element-mobilizing transposase RayT
MARPKHRTKPGETYFVTTDTWERRKVFLKGTAAELVEAKLFEYRDKGHYCVHSYVVMPEHFHVLLTPGKTTTLERAMGLIKGGSSFEIGKALHMQFPVWHEGFTEHEIRDEEDYETHVRYIESNPVKAGLVRETKDYPYCSLNGKYRLDPWPVASGAKAP